MQMLKSLRFLLYPFSLLYGLVIWIRNRLFDKETLRSMQFDFPVICIGNLSVGGTGKTPMAEYIIGMLRGKYKLACLSRGYKRKTQGFVLAEEGVQSTDLGDEPMQIHLKYPEVTVAVVKDRILGIPQLLKEKPETEVIIMDDAFQYREVRAGINILLTDYNHLYTRDRMLPVGNLRDSKSSSSRADIIVVTKCTPNLNKNNREDIIRELNPLPHQQVYFTEIAYGKPYHLFTGKELSSSHQGGDILLVCGIANPRPLQEAVHHIADDYEMLRYSDHHRFTEADVQKIVSRFVGLKNTEKIILTTEKDAVKLTRFQKEIGHLPFYVLPMNHSFLFGEAGGFEDKLVSYIESVRNIDPLDFAPLKPVED